MPSLKKTAEIGSLFASIALALTLGGCNYQTETAGESIDSAAQELVGVDEFLYFRCNATGWGVDDKTLLQPTSDPYLFAIEYDVKQSWMTGGGDSCMLTRTNAKNAWGTSQTFFGSRLASPVTVPGGYQLSSTSGLYANIKYPSLGRYRATVNYRQGSVQIEAVRQATGPSVTCGDAECSTGAGNVCCHDRKNDSFACLPASACTSLDATKASLACDDASDCGSGTVCCASSVYLTIQTLCLPASECVDSTAGRYSVVRDPVCDPAAGNACTTGSCSENDGWPELTGTCR